MKTQADHVFEDLMTNHKEVFQHYQSLMQIFYRDMTRQDVPNAIPRSQVKALLAMLDHCGYRVVKKPVLQLNNNVIRMTER
jgi:hypothetical protein